jgi:hypothetical protein
MTAPNFLQLPAQHLYYLSDGFVISPIPPPLTMLGCLDQSGLRQYRHVMRYGRLRKVDALFDVAAA